MFANISDIPPYAPVAQRKSLEAPPYVPIAQRKSLEAPPYIPVAQREPLEAPPYVPLTLRQLSIPSTFMEQTHVTCSISAGPDITTFAEKFKSIVKNTLNLPTLESSSLHARMLLEQVSESKSYKKAINILFKAEVSITPPLAFLEAFLDNKKISWRKKEKILEVVPETIVNKGLLYNKILNFVSSDKPLIIRCLKHAIEASDNFARPFNMRILDALVTRNFVEVRLIFRNVLEERAADEKTFCLFMVAATYANAFDEAKEAFLSAQEDNKLTPLVVGLYFDFACTQQKFDEVENAFCEAASMGFVSATIFSHYCSSFITCHAKGLKLAIPTRGLELAIEIGDKNNWFTTKKYCSFFKIVLENTSSSTLIKKLYVIGKKRKFLEKPILRTFLLAACRVNSFEAAALIFNENKNLHDSINRSIFLDFTARYGLQLAEEGKVDEARAIYDKVHPHFSVHCQLMNRGKEEGKHCFFDLQSYSHEIGMLFCYYISKELPKHTICTLITGIGDPGSKNYLTFSLCLQDFINESKLCEGLLVEVDLLNLGELYLYHAPLVTC